MTDITKPIYGDIWANAGETLNPGTTKIATGWIQEMMPYQYENFLQNRTDIAISYLLQKGIPEWSAEQEYTANKSVVTYGGQLYMATTTTTNVLPTVVASWKRLTISFGVNGAVPISFGGTGATTAADARTNLGIGSAATANLPVGNGMLVNLADNTLVARSVAGTAGYITVTNGDGVAGNPTINVGANVAKTDADAAWTTTSSIRLPAGSTAQRGAGAPGRIRFNLETGVYEGYDNTGWNPIGSVGALDVQNFQGDGVRTTFTLSSTPRSENNTQVYFNGVYQQKNTYNLVGNDLVFDEAPTSDISIEVVNVSSVPIGTTTAAQTSIVDSGNYYNSSNVEGALQQAGGTLSKSILSFSTFTAAQAAAATLPDGQVIDVAVSNTRYSVSGGLLTDERPSTPVSVPSGVVRSVQSKLLDTVSVKDFGAVSGGSFDNGPAIRYSIASSAGVVFVQRGTYSSGASAGSVADITQPISLRGDGGVYTAINPEFATAADDTLKITPDVSFDFTNVAIEKLAFHNPNFGTRTGRYGIFIDTQISGSNAALFKVRDVLVGQGSNYGLKHLNNPANNINGGLYAAIFEGNSIKGGVHLENSGDSNNIVHNIITGENIGVNASLVSGASLLEIQANNITNAGGAIRLDSGSRFRILGNNIENYSPGSASQNNSAVVNLAGENGTMYGGVVQQNLVSAFASSDATTLLRMRNCRGTVVQDNVFLGGSSATVGIDIGNDCQDVRIGPNTFNAGVTTQVNDAGVGTMGVIKTPTLQNGWTAFSAIQSTLKYIKSADGMVHVFGIIAGGTITNSTLVATLAPGFRPSEIIRSQIMVVNAGTPQIAEMSVHPDGSLRITYVLSNDQVNINFSFPAAGLANATSLE